MRTRIHVNLSVRDLDRSIAFYSRLFGKAPSKTRDDYANWRLDEPALHLAVVHNPDHEKTDTHEHFGVELFDGEDLAGWRTRAEQAGLELRNEKQVTCCYAVADKFWAADPDGNEWEFWVRSADAEQLTSSVPMSTKDEAACCAPAPATETSKSSDEPCCG